MQLLILEAKSPNVQHKKVQVRKGFMGFITKLGCMFRDSSICALKEATKTMEGWESFVCYVCSQERTEAGVLGGRIRSRHVTCEDLKYVDRYVCMEVTQDCEKFRENTYWSIPIREL